MRVDAKWSDYEEDQDAHINYTRQELRQLRFLLRRLQFLETKIRTSGGSADGASDSSFVRWEIEALAFVLTQVGFLRDKKADR